MTEENATPTYTGPTTAATAPRRPRRVDVALTATVAQAADGNLGDLSTATATFNDSTTSDHAVHVAGHRRWRGGLHVRPRRPGTYQVKVDVGGRFTGTTAADTALTVTATPAPPAPDTLLTSGPAAWLLDATASFVFSSTLAGSTFACTTDGVVGAVHLAVRAQRAEPDDPRRHHRGVQGRPDRPDPGAQRVHRPGRRRRAEGQGRAWKRKKAADAYLGTYSKTKKKGAVLTFKVKDARALALIVGKAPKYGKVKVFLGKKLLKTVKLKGPKAGRQLVVLGTFAVPTSGKLRIVTASGKTVRIEGLGVATTL